MKVIYKGAPEDRATDWFEKDAVYTVLSIEIFNKEIMYRLIEIGSTIPALHPASYFDVITKYIPSYWVVDTDVDASYLSITPKAWAETGFWEKYFAQDPEAVSIFQFESKHIIEEESNK